MAADPFNPVDRRPFVERWRDVERTGKGGTDSPDEHRLKMTRAVEDVYVVGAGCSVPAGLPGVAGFPAASAAIRKSRFRAKGLIDHALALWKDYPEINIEELFVLAEMRKVWSMTAPGSIDVPAVQELIRATLLDAKHDAQHYRRLVRQLPKRTVVVSLNWDTVLDDELSRKYDVDWGFNELTRAPPSSPPRTSFTSSPTAR